MINWLFWMFVLDLIMVSGTLYYFYLFWAAGMLAMLKAMARQNRWGLKIRKIEHSDWMDAYEERK